MVWEYLFNSQVSNILDTYPEVELLSSIRILFNFLKNHYTFKIYFKWKSDIIFFVWNLGIICALANNAVKKWKVQVTQSCLTLCDSMVSRAHGSLQVRILDWVALFFSRGSSQHRVKTRSPALQEVLYQMSHREDNTASNVKIFYAF